MRRCSKCKEEKSLAMFSKGQTYCKPCHRASVRASKLRHPETKKRNRALHMAKELATNRAYKKLNKERINAINRNRKARMLFGRFDNHAHSEVQKLLSLQRGKCAICHADVRAKYQVDHVVPLSAGGANDRLNLQILCPPCNLAKRAHDPIQYMQSIGRLL